MLERGGNGCWGEREQTPECGLHDCHFQGRRGQLVGLDPIFTFTIEAPMPFYSQSLCSLKISTLNMPPRLEQGAVCRPLDPHEHSLKLPSERDAWQFGPTLML
eukprot:1152522-Pelagomonas_calceolata.AAC.1